MAHERPLRVLAPVSLDDRVDDGPQEPGLVDDVARLGRERLDVGAQVGHEIVDEAGLAQEVREVVGPAHALQAGCERGRVADEDDRLGVELGGQPRHRARIAMGSLSSGRARRARHTANRPASLTIRPASRVDPMAPSSAA